MVSQRVISCRFTVAACIIALGPWMPAAVAWSEPASSADSTTAGHEAISEVLLSQWIEQLAADNYATRERAADSLIRAGTAAEAVLREAAEDAELETQLQAKRILALVLEAAIENRIEAFESDVDGSLGVALPGWMRVRVRLGESAEGGESGKAGDVTKSRRLFVQLYRVEPTLFAAYEESLDRAGSVIANRIVALRKALQGRTSVHIHYHYQTPTTPLRNNILALLLVGSDPEVTVDTSHTAQFDHLIQQVFPAGQFGELSSAALFREWIGDWIEHRTTDTALEHRHLLMGMAYGAEKTICIAERMLRAKKSDPHRQMYAALCVALFGDERHVALIEPLLEEEAPVRTTPVPAGNRSIRHTTQLRDIALAVLIRLTEQDYVEYGLKRAAVGHPSDVYKLQSIYFENPAKREQALKKWRAWRAAQPG